MATATGALRRVLLPAIRRRLTTGTGQPLISFTGARAGTTKAHQAEVAARRQLRKQKLREDGLSGMVDHVGMWLIITGAAPFTFLYCWALLRRDCKPQVCSHQSDYGPAKSVYESLLYPFSCINLLYLNLL